MIGKVLKLFVRIATRPISIIHCKIDPSSYARSLGVKVGKDVRFIGLKPNGEQFGSEPYLIEIGDHVTITAKVQFVNHDGGMWIFRKKRKGLNVFGKIKVGSNCFIGVGTLIMPGVTIGDDCVIGAGSIVTKDVPDGMVAAGVPARIICTIEEYYQKNENKMDDTIFTSNEGKRAYLLDKYG